MLIVDGITIGQRNDLDAWSDVYRERTDQPAGTATHSDQLIAQAIVEFRTFALAYLRYFDGLPESKFIQKMSRSRLSARALQAIDTYWSPLGEVAAQHLLVPYRTHLDKGAELAQEHLQRNNILLPGVLVYFNKVYSIRFLPYTNVAFTAVPYTHIARKDADWMSIPHELGHYLYWNLAADIVAVRKKHDEILDRAKERLENMSHLIGRTTEERGAIIQTVLGWWEEIFADVAGVKWAGVDFAKSFSTLLNDVANDVGTLVENDGSHPPLCLRPMLREYTLDQLGLPRSGQDWPWIIMQQFGVVFDSITLHLPSPGTRSILSSLPTETLVELLMDEGDTDFQSITARVELSIADAIAMLSQMADLALEYIDEFIKTPDTDLDKSSAFAKLLEQAEQSADKLKIEPFEVLLEPRVVEGGEKHAHNCRALGNNHWISTHTH